MVVQKKKLFPVENPQKVNRTEPHRTMQWKSAKSGTVRYFGTIHNGTKLYNGTMSSDIGNENNTVLYSTEPLSGNEPLINLFNHIL